MKKLNKEQIMLISGGNLNCSYYDELGKPISYYKIIEVYAYINTFHDMDLSTHYALIDMCSDWYLIEISNDDTKTICIMDKSNDKFCKEI